MRLETDKELEDYSKYYQLNYRNKSGNSKHLELKVETLRNYKVYGIKKHEKLVGGLCLIEGKYSRSFEYLQKIGKSDILGKMDLNKIIEISCAFRSKEISRIRFWYRVWLPGVIRCIFSGKEIVIGTYKESGMRALYESVNPKVLHKDDYGLIYLVTGYQLFKILLNKALGLILVKETLSRKGRIKIN